MEKFCYTKHINVHNSQRKRNKFFLYFLKEANCPFSWKLAFSIVSRMDHAEINTLKAFDEKLLSNCVRGPPTWETVKNLYVYRKTSSDIQREMEKENDNFMIPLYGHKQWQTSYGFKGNKCLKLRLIFKKLERKLGGNFAWLSLRSLKKS